MTLLIIDDEELTRTGIVETMNWPELGIGTVLQADDGIRGLEMARIHRPDIMLCDIRMPRMDGIEMLSQIESFLPDTIVIFMSGYSDKEYLKAAIRFQAVSYIEKPFLPSEMEDAIREAVRRSHQKTQIHRGRALLSKALSSRLASCLTEPYGSQKEEIARIAAELCLPLGADSWFCVLLLHMEHRVDLSNIDTDQIGRDLESQPDIRDLSCLCVTRRENYLACVLVSPSVIHTQPVEKSASYLMKRYSVYGKCYLTIGDIRRGEENCYESFASAVVLMQSTFFFPEGSILRPADRSAAAGDNREFREEAPDFEEKLSSALDTPDADRCRSCLTMLHDYFGENMSVFPNDAKDLYFRLLLLVEKAAGRYLLETPSSEESIVSSLENCFSFSELHEMLSVKTEHFLSGLNNRSREDAAIVLIRSYIAGHYRNPSLSVKDISAHVFLSASYLCTYFKNETGTTLNQYITSYRMEKAKELLSDLRYKIADISAMVGYNDGNYFGKSFKKYTGLSPSEFREKMLP